MALHKFRELSRPKRLLSCQPVQYKRQSFFQCHVTVIQCLRLDTKCSQGELRCSPGELRCSQGELRCSQGELKYSQGELKYSQGELKYSQGELKCEAIREMNSIKQEHQLMACAICVNGLGAR
jgi:hypothetical protein